ncbi:MAG: hypothetical protein AVO35_03420 [Candidatus Aegiribacteria sp. MLS_C]|nr:MAG: hypothetical protein AVO35_03420 [Candidatus Aegiribacteria sp. MLS_C]
MLRYVLASFRSVAVSMLLLSGCGGGGNGMQGERSPQARMPLVAVSFREMPSSADVPWALRRGRGDLSAAVLVNGEQDPGGWMDILMEARSSGLLVALFSDRVPGMVMGPDDILIWTDSMDRVHAEPPELASQLPSTMALDSAKYHGLVLELCEMYKPDIVVIDIAPGNEGLLLSIAARWTSPEVLSSYRVVLFSAAGGSGRRGWCAMAGSGINGNVPPGVTVSGLFSTVRILAGMDWVSRLPGSVPALAVLEDPSAIWDSR